VTLSARLYIWWPAPVTSHSVERVEQFFTSQYGIAEAQQNDYHNFEAPSIFPATIRLGDA
jgi:hypothetical protein